MNNFKKSPPQSQLDSCFSLSSVSFTLKWKRDSDPWALQLFTVSGWGVVFFRTEFSVLLSVSTFSPLFFGQFRAAAQLWAAQIWQQQSMFCYKREFITAAAAARQAEGAAAAWLRVSNEQAWPVNVHCARLREQTPTFTLAMDLDHSYSLFKETLAAADITNGCQYNGVNIPSSASTHPALRVAGCAGCRSLLQAG